MTKRFTLAGVAVLLAAFLVGFPASAQVDYGYHVHSGHGNVWINGAFVADGRSVTIKFALDRLSENQLPFYLYSGAHINGYAEVANFIDMLIPGYRPGALAYTYAQGNVWLTDELFNTLSPSAFMVTLVHEADHRRYGGHTCGEGADADDNGSYGVDAYYSAKLYRESTGMDGHMIHWAAANALEIANYRVCGNTVARDRILAAFYNGVFAPVPPPPPPPRRGGCRAGALRYIC